MCVTCCLSSALWRHQPWGMSVFCVPSRKKSCCQPSCARRNETLQGPEPDPDVSSLNLWVRCSPLVSAAQQRRRLCCHLSDGLSRPLFTGSSISITDVGVGTSTAIFVMVLYLWGQEEKRTHKLSFISDSPGRAAHATGP